MRILLAIIILSSAVPIQSDADLYRVQSEYRDAYREGLAKTCKWADLAPKCSDCHDGKGRVK